MSSSSQEGTVLPGGAFPPMIQRRKNANVGERNRRPDAAGIAAAMETADQVLQRLAGGNTGRSLNRTPIADY
ncbi:hypothetical protein GYB59_07780 [bacterium]|nr:hypothetical protein [bacterium]